MPDTRPGIKFDENGVCYPCLREEKKDHIDWNARYRELEKLCNKYRKNSDEYDCIIAVSGGKDSHFQVHIIKNIMQMNPLLVSVTDNFPMTKAGQSNFDNISEAFGCDIIVMKPNINLQKNLMRKTFENYGKPTWHIDRLIYTYPLHMAIKFNIPLVVFGENISLEYGGPGANDTYSAIDQIENGVASDISWEELIDENISMKDLVMLKAPTKEEMDSVHLDPIYLSYFMRWNDYRSYNIAKRYGFKDLANEWEREHHIENFYQVDNMAYLIHPWMKYPKFGHATATDAACRFIKIGKLTREQGIELVKKHDHKLDQRAVQEFCDFLGYTRAEFYAIVDKFYNPDLFTKDPKTDEWILKDPIWSH